MEEIISAYQSLIEKLEEEYEQICGCLQGEILSRYQQILDDEKQRIQKMKRKLM